MKKLALVLLLLTGPAHSAILFKDAGKVLGQMKMLIVPGVETDKWVFYKFQLQFSETSPLIHYCYVGKLINPDNFQVMPETSVYEFLQYFGPLPNTFAPISSQDPWCYP